MSIQTSRVTTAPDTNLELDPNGNGKVQINSLQGVSAGDSQVAVDNLGQIKKLNADDLSPMGETVPGDKIIVHAGSNRVGDNIQAGEIYAIDAEDLSGVKGIDPSPADISANPGFLGGNGSQSSPYICSPATVSEAGGSAESIQEITVVGTELGLVSFIDISSGEAAGRFQQPAGQITNGSYTFRLKYIDNPLTPIGKGQVYDGEVQLGASTVYFKWAVSQASNASGFGPTESPTASPSTVNYAPDGKYGQVEANWADGNRGLRVDGALKFSVNQSALNASSKNIEDGDVLRVAFDETVVEQASEGDIISGSLESDDGVYYNSFSMVKDITPASFTIPQLTDQPVNAVATSEVIVLRGFNAPVQITGFEDATGQFTSLEVNVNNAGFVPVSVGSPVTYNPGDSLLVRGTTGSTENATYSATLTIAGQTATFSASTGAGIDAGTGNSTVAQPSILTPANFDGNKQSQDVDITSSPFRLVGSGSATHASSSWEAWEAGAGASSEYLQTGVITNTAPNTPPGAHTLTFDSNAGLSSMIIGHDVQMNAAAELETSAITNVSRAPAWPAQIFSSNVTASSQLSSPIGTNYADIFDGRFDTGVTMGTFGQRLDATIYVEFPQVIYADSLTVHAAQVAGGDVGSFRPTIYDETGSSIRYDSYGYSLVFSNGEYTITWPGGPKKISAFSFYVESGRNDVIYTWYGLSVNSFTLVNGVAGPEGQGFATLLTTSDSQDLKYFEVGDAVQGGEYVIEDSPNNPTSDAGIQYLFSDTGTYSRSGRGGPVTKTFYFNPPLKVESNITLEINSNGDSGSFSVIDVDGNTVGSAYGGAYQFAARTISVASTTLVEKFQFSDSAVPPRDSSGSNPYNNSYKNLKIDGDRLKVLNPTTLSNAIKIVDVSQVSNNKLGVEGGNWGATDGTGTGGWNQSASWSNLASVGNDNSQTVNLANVFDGNEDSGFSMLISGTTPVWTFGPGTGLNPTEIIVRKYGACAVEVNTSGANPAPVVSENGDTLTFNLTGSGVFQNITFSPSSSSNNSGLKSIVVNGQTLVDSSVTGGPTLDTTVSITKTGKGKVASVNLNSNQMVVSDVGPVFVANDNGKGVDFRVEDVLIPGIPLPPATEPPSGNYTKVRDLASSTTYKTNWPSDPANLFSGNSTVFTRVKYESSQGQESEWSNWSGFEVRNGVPAPWLSGGAIENADWMDVTYGGSDNGVKYFVAVDGTPTNKVAYSVDGVNWTIATVPGNERWQCVEYGNGVFVAAANSTERDNFMYSTNGTSWTLVETPSPGTNQRWFDIVFTGTKFVAVGTDANCAFSTDGTSWSTGTALPNAGNYSAIAYGNGTLVAVTGDGAISTSSDGGSSWIERNPKDSGTNPDANSRTCVAYGNGTWVSLSRNNSNRIAYSVDNGVTWTAIAAPEDSNYWNDIHFANGKFVALAQSGTNQTMYSYDGINWITAPSTSSGGWKALTHGLGRFVAVGANTTNTMYVDA